MPDQHELEIDGRVCAGHGRCYAVAPDLFDIDDDEGRGRVLAQPRVDQLDDAERAVQNCPEQAISLRMPTTGEKEKA